MRRPEAIGSWPREPREFATDPLDEGNLPLDLLPLSRHMARVLRHSGPEIGLVIGPDGWCPLSALMQVEEIARHPKEDVIKVVEESFSKSRPRFELKDEDGADGALIRATHKHTYMTGRPRQQQRHQQQQYQPQQRPPPRVVPPPVRAKVAATPVLAPPPLDQTPVNTSTDSTDSTDPLKSTPGQLAAPAVLSVQSVATPQRQPHPPSPSSAREEDPWNNGQDPWATGSNVADVKPKSSSLQPLAAAAAKPPPPRLQQARAMAEAKQPPPQFQGNVTPPVANHGKSGPNSLPQTLPVVVALSPCSSVSVGGKPPPPSPPPPMEHAAAASLAAATHAALARRAVTQASNDSSDAGDSSTANPAGNCSSHQQGEQNAMQEDPASVEMASISLLQNEASKAEAAAPEAEAALENAGSVAANCDKYGGKVLDASAAAVSAEVEEGLAQAADGIHGASNGDVAASSSSLTGGNGDNKAVSSLQRTWEQYSLPDGGFWWSTIDSNSWFLESSPHPWEKYKIPDQEKCYWWNQDTEEYFVLP